MSTKPGDSGTNARIEKLVYGGDGLARQGETTVFVPYVIPGEEIRLGHAARKKKFVRAQIGEILEASPGRVAPLCRHFTRCGGCHYQQMPHEMQLRWKTEILRETLRRLGRIEWTDEIALHSASPWEYRNRAQWKVRLLQGGSSRESGVGYFRAGTEELCPVEECPIVSPLLQKTLRSLRDAASRNQIPPGLREVEAFADSSDEAMLVTAAFSTSPANAERAAHMLQSILPGRTSVCIQGLSGERGTLSGPAFLDIRVAEYGYRVSFDSFFQVNRFLLEDLLATATTIAGEGSSLLDLYAGVGFFSLPLARRFARVHAVESGVAASGDLAMNIARAGGGASAERAPVEDFLRRAKVKPDVVLLDPPRAGVAPEALDPLAALRAPKILYLSCEPSTLARDLAGLFSRGYVVRSIDLFDMFPQTYHIESLVVLEQSS
jgi:23S rRNA (uracil1939-C5)-methyltransferase